MLDHFKLFDPILEHLVFLPEKYYLLEKRRKKNIKKYVVNHMMAPLLSYDHFGPF